MITGILIGNDARSRGYYSVNLVDHDSHHGNCSDDYVGVWGNRIFSSDHACCMGDSFSRAFESKEQTPEEIVC